MGLRSGLSTSTVVREAERKPNNKMAELGLKKKEVEAIDFAFDVYDFKGDGNVDASTPEISSVPAISTPPSKLLLRSEESPKRARRCLRRPRCTPSTRLPRTPRTRVDSTTSLRS